jgi:hypothetical protein
MAGIPAREAASRQLGLTGDQRSKLVFRLDAEAPRALAMAGRNVFDMEFAPFVRHSTKLAAKWARLEFGVVCPPAKLAATNLWHFILNSLTYK